MQGVGSRLIGRLAFMIGALSIAASSPVWSQDAPRTMTVEPVALDNPYVRVSRNEAPCARAEPGRCEDRVILAMGNLTLVGPRGRRQMKRAEIAIFRAGETYESPSGGPYYEIAIKPGHPPVKSPPELIPAPMNLVVHKSARFFIYEERLPASATRPRHSHSQRVEIRLNTGPMLHQWVWRDDKMSESEPSIVNWREPVVHEVRNIGDAPLRNFILEFYPEHPPAAAAK